jgi:hypothetical protein
MLTPRQQLNVLCGKSPKRLAFSNVDRLIFAGLYQTAPCPPERLGNHGARDRYPLASSRFSLVLAMEVAAARRQAEGRAGNPPIGPRDEPGQSIGAPRIHRELPKLGFDFGQTSIAKYLAMRKRPPSQWWKTFLRNHADGIASMDLFVVPTISFRLLYGLLIMPHGRRQMLWLGVTEHPTPEWVARQLTQACGGAGRRDTSSMIATVSMARYSNGVFVRWEFVTDRLRDDRHGRMDILNG